VPPSQNQMFHIIQPFTQLVACVVNKSSSYASGRMKPEHTPLYCYIRVYENAFLHHVGGLHTTLCIKELYYIIYLLLHSYFYSFTIKLHPVCIAMSIYTEILYIIILSQRNSNG